MMDQLASNDAVGDSSNSGTPSELLDSVKSDKTTNASDEPWDELETLGDSTLSPSPSTNAQPARKKRNRDERLASSSDANSGMSSELLDSINSDRTTNASDEPWDELETLGDSTLPPLPSTNAQPAREKRDRDEPLASSSDAPLFSSDDLLASSSDLYLDENRRKRLHRGAWYREEQVPIDSTTQGSPTQKPRSQGLFRGNMDSGIFPGSDESTGSEEARYSRILAIRKARIVMDMGGSMDDDEGAANLPGSIDVLGRDAEIEDEFAAVYHKSTQYIEDQEGFEGLVFPYVSVTSIVTWNSNANMKCSTSGRNNHIAWSVTTSSKRLPTRR